MCMVIIHRDVAPEKPGVAAGTEGTQQSNFSAMLVCFCNFVPRIKRLLITPPPVPEGTQTDAGEEEESPAVPDAPDATPGTPADSDDAGTETAEGVMTWTLTLVDIQV